MRNAFPGGKSREGCGYFPLENESPPWGKTNFSCILTLKDMGGGHTKQRGENRGVYGKILLWGQQSIISGLSAAKCVA